MITQWIYNFEKKIRALGVTKGDSLYFSSDISALLFTFATKYQVKTQTQIDAAFDRLVDTLLSVIGEEGTLLFPVFTWSFSNGRGFDYYKTKGEVGTLSNWVMKNRRDFKRTRHPLYSFMVKGKDAQYLASLDNQDGWGPASPFQYLKERGAKQILFGIEAYEGLTFVHYVEQCVHIPYRHLKYWLGDYTDERGLKEKRVYSLYVRQMGVVSHNNVHNQFLIEKGVAEGAQLEDDTVVLVRLGDCYRILEQDMLHNGAKNTLKLENYELDWTAGHEGIELGGEFSG